MLVKDNSVGIFVEIVSNNLFAYKETNCTAMPGTEYGI